MKRGGYSCAMKSCPNISGRESGTSFFRFPKDTDRAKLWLEKCDREINTKPENLHKNYRVCGDHFISSMFLNNLKNRLQPHAIPVLVKNNNESFELSSGDNATFSLSDKSKENLLTLVECDIIKSDCDKQRIKTEFLDKVECQSVSVNNHEVIINGQHKHEQVESMVHQQHQHTQTEPKLSNHSPREKTLRRKIIALQRKVRQLRLQLERQKNNIKTSARKFSLEEYCKATDEFLPPQIAIFVKTQVRLSNYKSAKGRKYSLPLKKFCLDILFSQGGRAYDSFAQNFIVPSVRTLQRMIQH